MERQTPAALKRALTVLMLLISGSLLTAQQYHELQRGETLYRLSRRYGVTVEALMAANNINDATDLAVGMKLRIPGGSETVSAETYRVKPGDTLYGIARIHGLSVDGLLTMNGLDGDHLLLVGEELRVGETPASGNGENRNGTDIEPDAGETRVVTAPGSGSDSPYYWPHQGTRQTLNGKLLGKEIVAAEGDPVLSVTSGKVIWVAPYHGYGKIVMVESPDKHIFAYGGNADTLVNVGDFVSPGQKIGLTGSAGRDDLPKVYFFVYKNGKPVDPDLAPRK